MRARHKGILIGLLAAIAMVAAQPALACSRRDWNSFEGAGVPPVNDVLARSATVDWIALEPPPPPCLPPSYPYLSSEDAEFETVPARPECTLRHGEAAGLDLTAITLERLKGASPDRFQLVLPPFDASAGQAARRFSDVRDRGLTRRVVFAIRERLTAEERHADLAWWHDGDLGPIMDGSNSCGGQQSLDPEMRYIAFRNAAGEVLALEPVLHDDDMLLAYLRAGANRPDGLQRPEIAVDALFATADRMVLADVLTCSKSGPSYRDEVGRIRVVRGDPRDVTDAQWSVEGSNADGTDKTVSYQYGEPGSRDLKFDELWDYFASRKEACPTGGQVLLATIGPRSKPGPSVDKAWLRERFPDWPLEPETPLVKEILSYGQSPGGFRIWPILVTDGRILLRDIPTGLRVIGPESISVDEAFAWQAARARQ